MIRKLVLIGGIIYIIIALVQGVENPVVLIEATLLIGILVILSLIHNVRDVARLKRVEMAALWVAIAFFVGYALLRAGGLL